MTGKQSSWQNQPTVRRRVAGLLKEVLIVVVSASIIAALIRAFVGQMFLIPSGSMEYTLNINDRIAVQKIASFKRGDVVVFKDPGGWLDGVSAPGERGTAGQVLEFLGILPDTSTGYLVKRVIGMPGDHVRCCDARGRITVNGQPLDEKSYLYSTAEGDQNAPSETRFDVVVPAGRIWVMGDHREDSRDSRCHLRDQSAAGKGMGAFVPVDDVVGTALAVVAPFNRAGPLHRPKTFDPVPAAKTPAPQKPIIQTAPAAC